MKTRITFDVSQFSKLAFSCTTLLAGCGTAALAPLRVEVPVFTPCVAAVPPRPVYEFEKLPATAMDGEVIMALVRDWTRGRKYEEVLAATVASCL